VSTPFDIRYLQTAEADLEAIFDYILVDNSPAAVSMLEKFDHAISRLAVNPEIGADPKDDRLRKPGYRVLVVGDYLVFYVVKSRTRTVQIRRIVHGARQHSLLL
jgi:addiction module RelE/StbE family toxin